MDRRGAIGLGAGLGLGGLLPARPDQEYFPAKGGQQIPGARTQLRATQVIVFGTGKNKGIFVYTGSPGFGNLIASITASGNTDNYGNAYLQGITNYQGGTTAVQFVSGQMRFLTAPGAGGPWTTEGSINITGTGGIMILTAPPGGSFTATGGKFSMNNGASVTGGLTADTELISSGQAAGLLLDVANTTGGATGALERLTVAAAGDLWTSARISGDTNPRWLLGTTAAGLTQIQMGPGNAAADIIARRLAANSLGILGADVAIDTAGRGLQIKEGTNAKQGVATLAAGTVVVANTSVTATSRIQLTAQDNNSTGALRVSARTAGTSFTITSSNAADSGVVAYDLFEAAP